MDVPTVHSSSIMKPWCERYRYHHLDALKADVMCEKSGSD